MQLIGVIHLLPLPAGPGRSPGLDAVITRARQDALALVEGGIGAAIVENLGDAPFWQGASDPHVLTMMTAATLAVRAEVGAQLQLGINVLRNDARGALAVAAATGASFVRVNVHLGAAWTDQGLIQGQAGETLRYRRELGLEPPQAGWGGDRTSGPGVRLAADVHVKHATPAGSQPIDDAALELVHRGQADVLIVSGRHTGGPTDPDDVRRVRAAVPGCPLWIGSGVDAARVRTFAGLVDGVIVGTSLHQDARLDLPLDVERVRRLVQAAGG